MKDITTLLNNQHTIQPDYTKEQKHRVRDFVASVFSLFADYRNEYTREDFFKDQCRLWAKEIIAMSESEYQSRLDKIKMLIGVPHLHGMHGNYKTPNSALAIACMPIDHINHDYFIAYPRNGNTGELKRIAEESKIPTDASKGLSELSKLKDLFK